jgi:polysaccharide deacetylase 2 family uncharacterized protein YibQ
MKALVVAASIVLLALMGLFGLLAVLPGPQGGSPVVTLAVTPPPPPKPAAVAPPPAAGPSIDLPPGFGISPQPQKGPAKPGAPQQQAGTNPGAKPEQTAGVPASPTPMPEAPESETGPVTLVAAPAEGLVEESRYGPLPKVAADGRRPLEVYARPSRYAAKAPAGAPPSPPRVALLINGMGLADAATTAAVMKLPAPVSIAYGAYGRNLQDGVDRARSDGHEVLLQIPLEPLDYPQSDPGPHTLVTTLPPEENLKRLQWLMSRFTGYVGVTNLMGAKFEATQNAFVPVLEEIKARGLLFIDDGTGKNSPAEKPPPAPGANQQAAPVGSTGERIAGALGLDYAVADIQIDTVPSPDNIAKALAQLEVMAKERGTAIGVASAKPETIKQVEAWAGQLQAKGFVLIPVSAAIRSQRQS